MRITRTMTPVLAWACAAALGLFVLEAEAADAVKANTETTGTNTARAEADQACDPKVMLCKLTPDLVAAALDKYDLDYEHRRNTNGDPLLIVKPGGLIHEQGMAAILYGCDEHNECDTLSLYTFFKTSEPLTADLYHIWNDIFRVRTWSKAFRDKDGDTGFVLNISAIGGTSPAALDFLTGVFLTEMGVFRDALRGVKKGTMTTASLKEPGGWDALAANAFDALSLTNARLGEIELGDNAAPKEWMGAK